MPEVKAAFKYSSLFESPLIKTMANEKKTYTYFRSKCFL